MDDPDRSPDRSEATRLAAARKRLLDAGGDTIPGAPWRVDTEPPAAIELTQFVVWKASTSRLDGAELLAALTLLPAVRAEIDQLETTLLRAARSEGLSWSRIALAMGLRSPQAAQQRLGRVAGRAGADPGRPASDPRPRSEYAGRIG
jgi:hypothetical protein